MSSSEKRKETYYYNQPIEELIKTFNADIYHGINSSELNERHLKYGYNELPKIKKSIWKIYLAPIFNFLILGSSLYPYLRCLSFNSGEFIP